MARGRVSPRPSLRGRDVAYRDPRSHVRWHKWVAAPWAVLHRDRHDHQRLLGRRDRGDVRRELGLHVRAGGPRPDGRLPGRARRRRCRARDGHRHRAGRDPPGRARRPGRRHRAVAADGGRAAPQAGGHPRRGGRHGHDPRHRRLHPRLRRLEQHRQRAHAGRAGRVLPQRCPPPRPGRPLRGRAGGARHPALPARPGRGAVPRRASPRRVRHLRHDHAAGHVPPLPPARRRHRQPTARATSATSGRPSAT